MTEYTTTIPAGCVGAAIGDVVWGVMTEYSEEQRGAMGSSLIKLSECCGSRKIASLHNEDREAYSHAVTTWGDTVVKWLKQLIADQIKSYVGSKVLEIRVKQQN